MRILILHCSYQYKGGEDTVVEEEMKLLISAGHQVKLLLFSNSGNELLKALQLPFNFSSYLTTKKIIKAYKPDIVHIHNLHFAASPSVMYAIARCKIPFVITLHNYRLLCPSGTLFFGGKIFQDSLKQNFPWSAIKKGVYKNSKIFTFWLSLSTKLHQWLGTWKLCNKYIVLSDFSRQLVLQSNLHLSPVQIVIKPNFGASYTISNVSVNNHFLYVGRLTEEKGILLLLNTFSALGYEIRIAGDGPLKNKVIEFSEKFSNIKFLGSLEKQDVLEQLRSCTALIFPSVWFEGMPLIIIEAFSTGTPVIASKLGAMESMIIHGYNGFHFAPGDQEDFSTQLTKWTKCSYEQKKSLRRNSLKSYREHYSPKSNVRQLEAIYNSVLLK